ncbi:MAG TPA: hypothetical protein VMG10_13035 [Gemmataceae bacterium]|nr:hypothetical protein [Gemmataceae bacterium]
MATVTAAPKSRKPQARTAHVTRLGDAYILWLTVGKDITAYRVLPLDSQMGGVAFRLEKADKGNGERESYEVLLDGQQSRCCCKGFEQHGMCKDGKGCKHIAGLTAAVAAKQLPIPQTKQETAAQPWCEHCNDNPDVYCSHCSF